MFDDAQLHELGIKPQYRDSKAHLFKAMAEEEKSSVGKISRDRLPLQMQRGHLGYLYQVCAECSFLSKTENGWHPLYEAATSYLSAGMPYGLALLAMRAGRPAQDGEWLHSEDMRPQGYLFQDDFKQFLADPHQDEEPELQEIKAHAQQQTWLCLAAARGQYHRDLVGAPLLRFRDNMKQHGHLPVGPLGIPVAAHLELFDAIERRKKQSTALNQVFATALVKRSELINAAQHNTYLWERLRTGVALIDFHLTILVAAAIRHELLTRSTLRNITSLFDANDPLYRLLVAPIELAFQSLNHQ